MKWMERIIQVNMAPWQTLSRWAGPSASNTIRAPRKTPPAFWRRVAMILPGDHRNDSCRAWIFHVGHPRPSAEASAGTASKRDSRLRTAGRETHCAPPKAPRALRLRYSYGGTQYPPNPCADTHIPAFRIYPHAHPKRNILITGTM